ncbi:unnamed protein product [Darwinula stevensoni]|uniref:Chromatin accessibility complex protein 1 n=1 Tax=Darwinula stevensoni TaxID=69355 RepID=A0A7R8XDU4_9CRUS|nr:unnamed protein product [Darwinula stevensoni]CAG0893609.1 unnamed protein product [Darwinula stevensoni]
MASDPEKKQRELMLPVSRIRMIMKSSPETESIGQESVPLIAKATELFIQHLIRKALLRSKDGQHVTYGDLANIVQGIERYEFLQDIVPSKITYQQYLEMMAKSEVDEDIP